MPEGHRPENAVEPDQTLRNGDRQRIIAEEEFRKRVAQQLDREFTSRRQRALRTMNTPLVLWALTTGLVGAITWGYQELASRQRAKEERTALRERNSTELLYRFGACDWIDSSSTRDDVENLLSSVIGLRPLHPQYQGRNLPALYLEFCFLGGNCSLPVDSVQVAGAAIRRLTWPEIVGKPIRPLQNRAMLPELRRRCDQLRPIGVEAHAVVDSLH
jgi:hypothetical protein